MSADVGRQMNLVMDVGGTNVRLALVDGAGALGASQTYTWAKAGSLAHGIEQFCAAQNRPASFAKLIVAFAGPIVPGMAVFTFTNAAQTFSISELRAFADKVLVVNDFVAQAALVPHMAAADCHIIKPGTANPAAARAILGPGTGLGVCAISDRGHLLPSEGGNTALPHLPQHANMIDALGTNDGPWRIEDVLSGPGIERVYGALGGGDMGAKAISEAAHTGDALALETMDCVFDFLALTCANQALQYSAAGGVFIVGNIVNINMTLLNPARFADVFTSIKTHADFLRQVPVTVVTRAASGLEGAAALLDDL